MRYHLCFLFCCLSSFVNAQDDFTQELTRAKALQSTNLDSALIEVNQLLDRISNSGDVEKLCKCLEQKGNTQTRLGAYDEAILSLTNAQEQCIESGDRATLASALNALGYIYDRKDSHELALEYFIKASNIYDELKDYEGIVKAYMNMVSIFGQQERVEKVKEYISKAAGLLERVEDPTQIARTYANAAAHYSEIGVKEPDYLDSASYLAKQGLVFSKNNYGNQILPDFFIVLATVALQQKQPNQAIAYCDSVFLYEESASYRTLIIASLRKAESFAQLKDFEASMKWYDSTETLIDKAESIFYKMVLEESKYESLKAMGNAVEALHALESFKALEDSVFTLERDTKIAELEAKFESERKAIQIASLENEVAVQGIKSSRQNWIIVALIVVTTSLALSIWLFYQKRLSKEKEQSAIHKQQLLRSQINPHFIFNSLSSIRGFLFDGNDTKPAILYLGKFAKLMRMVLELSSKEWVTLADEVKALELYLEIQQIRFNKSFDFDLSIDPSIDPNEIIVPPLTAQPFIENAIEHGLKGLDQPGKVEVACLKKGGRLVFKIQDNGIGIDHVERRENHQSRATQIFSERLGIIGRRMKMKFSFDISDIGNNSDQHGTLVTYELPLLTA